LTTHTFQLWLICGCNALALLFQRLQQRQIFSAQTIFTMFTMFLRMSTISSRMIHMAFIFPSSQAAQDGSIAPSLATNGHACHENAH